MIILKISENTVEVLNSELQGGCEPSGENSRKMTVEKTPCVAEES